MWAESTGIKQVTEASVRPAPQALSSPFFYDELGSAFPSVSKSCSVVKVFDKIQRHLKPEQTPPSALFNEYLLV